MKKIVLLFVLAMNMLISNKASTQNQKFDITGYTAPKGWVKSEKPETVTFTKEDKTKDVFCTIALYKSKNASTDSKVNFDASWESIVQKALGVGEPQMQPVANENGWGLQSGSIIFEKEDVKGMAMLITATANTKMVNLLIVTNTNQYENEMGSFIESIKLPKVEPQEPSTANTAKESTNETSDANADILGTWVTAKSVTPESGNPASWGAGGYSKSEYIFNENGTYFFYNKIFGYMLANLILIKESGRYTTNGNNITITPSSSVVEEWSKKDKTDKWGKLLSSQKRALEKTTYQFTKYYYDYLNEWNLVLQAETPTKRDGAFSNNTTFPNAYYYSVQSSSRVPIDLPAGQK